MQEDNSNNNDGEEDSRATAAAALGALTLETEDDDEDSASSFQTPAATPAASPATAFHDASAPNPSPSFPAPPRATAAASSSSSSLSPRRPSAALDLGQRKHTFILSHAGKPVFSRYGDEQQLAPFMGMVQAILALSQSVSGGERPQDCVRAIRTKHGKRQFVFLVRQELTLLVVTSTKEPEPFLKLQLEYLYQQVVLLLTARRIERCFAANASYDLRELLGGTASVLAGVVDMALPQHDSVGCLMTGAVPTLPLDPTVREELGQGLVAVCAKTPRLQQVLYGLVLCGTRLVTLVQPKEPVNLQLRASDLLLLMNFVTTQPSFKVTESWTPVCLPRFNNTGFLYAYVGCLDPEHDVFLLLVSANDDTEQFKACCACRAQAQALMQERGWLKAVTEAATGEARTRALNRYSNAAMAFHFLYKFSPPPPSGLGSGNSTSTSTTTVSSSSSNGNQGSSSSSLPQCISSSFFFPYVDEEAKQGVWNKYATALLQLRYGGKAQWSHAGDATDRLPTNNQTSRALMDEISSSFSSSSSAEDSEKKKHSPSMMDVFEKPPEHSLVYEIRETDCLVVSVGPDFELFALLSAAPDMSETLHSLNRLIRAVKRDERWLFMVRAQHW